MLFLEEMAVDPVETLSSVFDFLGMDFIDEAEGTKVKTGLDVSPQHQRRAREEKVVTFLTVLYPLNCFLRGLSANV